MEAKSSRCITCNKDIKVVKHSVIFKCPGCGDKEIVRCGQCRTQMRLWNCSVCGFEGP
ncbi:MAG: DUF1610 domain-containing protein [Candidatus Altiarchaeota archaeon]|nr:DUF1610 domain-containing protein [Candidatus Altiarchaeota archaeon]